MKRTTYQKLLDTFTFPIRAFCLHYEDRRGLSALSTERYDYAAREVKGYCLDIGCGRHNRFVNEFLNGNGFGIDVFPYEGLSKENVVESLDTLPFEDSRFDSVTFIACINHVPEPKRDLELAEAYRVLKPGGNVIITMGNPLAELAVHQVVHLRDKLLHTKDDLDSERGMDKDEAYFLTDYEIVSRMKKARFDRIKKKYFFTQWGLNHLFVGWKPQE